MRDRTAELLAIADRVKNASQATVPTSAPVGPGGSPSRIGVAPSSPVTLKTAPPTFASQSDFAKRASRIGQAIHGTSSKLARLAQLAKRTSMFDDPAQEINDLTVVIKQDITSLNSAIEDLQSVSASKKREGMYNAQSGAHSTTVVDSLRARLKDATKEFKDVLTLRTENLKNNQNRRKIFSNSDSLVGGASAPLLPRKALSSSAASQPGGKASPFLGSTNGGLPPGATPPSMQQQLMAPVEDSYMDSRAEALRNVESTIVELGGIFEQLAHMVAEQGEMAVRIDENVDETVNNMESAQAQLMRYYNTISSNRWLAMKVFSILLFFAVIFVIFIA